MRTALCLQNRDGFLKRDKKQILYKSIKKTIIRKIGNKHER